MATKNVLGLAVCAAVAGLVVTPGFAADVGVSDFVGEREENSFTLKWIQRSAQNIDGILVGLVDWDRDASSDFELVSLKFPNHQSSDAGFNKWGDELESGMFQGMTSETDADFRFDVKFDGNLVNGRSIKKASQISFAWDIYYFADGEITHGFRWSNDSAFASGLEHVSGRAHGGSWYRLEQLPGGAAVPLPHPAVMAASGIVGFAAARRRR